MSWFPADTGAAVFRPAFVPFFGASCPDPLSRLRPTRCVLSLSARSVLPIELLGLVSVKPNYVVSVPYEPFPRLTGGLTCGPPQVVCHPLGVCWVVGKKINAVQVWLSYGLGSQVSIFLSFLPMYGRFVWASTSLNSMTFPPFRFPLFVESCLFVSIGYRT